MSIVGRCVLCLDEKATFEESDRLETLVCTRCGCPPDLNHPVTQGALLGYLFRLNKDAEKFEEYKNRTVPEIMRDAADVFEGRNAAYGNSFERHGETMVSLFPDGLTLHSIEDWNRLFSLTMIVNKTMRYAHSFTNGGHVDSATDGSVYFAMLEKLTKKDPN